MNRRVIVCIFFSLLSAAPLHMIIVNQDRCKLIYIANSCCSCPFQHLLIVRSGIVVYESSVKNPFSLPTQCGRVEDKVDQEIQHVKSSSMEGAVSSRTAKDIGWKRSGFHTVTRMVLYFFKMTTFEFVIMVGCHSSSNTL